MRRLLILFTFLLPVLAALAQSRTLTGKITDENGKQSPGLQ
ncbi:MAG: hypothetical protein WDO71_13345 [Bacteroidota bacterium]